MQVVTPLLLVAALALLVIGLLVSKTVWIVASLVVSVIAVLAIRDARRRATEARAQHRTDEVDRVRPTSAREEIAELARQAAAEQAVVSELVPPSLVVSLPGSGEVAVGDEDPVDEPPSALTRPPLSSKGQQPVWVVDGRPRYHVASCTFIAGQEAEAIPLEQAVEDGFSPCSLCDPDTALARS